MSSPGKYENDTMKLFQKLHDGLFFCGLTDFWIEEGQLPNKLKRIFIRLSIFNEIMMFSFMVSELLSLLTQHNLSPKQVADQLVFAITHPVLYSFGVTLTYHKKSVKEVLNQLAMSLKQVYNDEGVEREMIAKLKFYLKAYVTSCGLCMTFYGASALLQNLSTGSTFTTVITVWPDVEDRSQAANISRVIIYFIWWIFFIRVSGAYVLILSMLIGLSFQYKNLACYFTEIQRIFDKPRGQSELERAFESATKIGIKLHIDTLWCVQECQKICSFIFSAQLVMTIAALVAELTQMMTSERDFVTMAAVVSITCGTMVGAGFLMWNAGDVTVEASYLADAMYACGWYNCSGASSARTRKLLAMAMTQAQKPVVFLGLGCVEISYETYLAIVKSSYSVFSMVY